MSLYLGTELYTLKSKLDTNTSDATIEPYEVMNGEIAYGTTGQVIGTAPFSFIGINESESCTQYKLTDSKVQFSADNCESRNIYIEDNQILLDLPIAEEVAW